MNSKFEYPLFPFKDCLNSFHCRGTSSAKFCFRCGEELNAAIPVKKCARSAHLYKSYRGDIFCGDCGERLAFIKLIN